MVTHALDGAIADVWHGYEDVLATYPLLVKCMISLAGFALADVVAQSLTERFQGSSEPYDVQRTARLALFGFFLYGPASTLWYVHCSSQSWLDHQWDLTSCSPPTTASGMEPSTSTFFPTPLRVLWRSP